MDIEYYKKHNTENSDRRYLAKYKRYLEFLNNWGKYTDENGKTFYERFLDFYTKGYRFSIFLGEDNDETFYINNSSPHSILIAKREDGEIRFSHTCKFKSYFTSAHKDFSCRWFDKLIKEEITHCQMVIKEFEEYLSHYDYLYSITEKDLLDNLNGIDSAGEFCSTINDTPLCWYYARHSRSEGKAIFLSYENSTLEVVIDLSEKCLEQAKKAQQLRTQYESKERYPTRAFLKYAF